MCHQHEQDQSGSDADVERMNTRAPHSHQSQWTLIICRFSNDLCDFISITDLCEQCLYVSHHRSKSLKILNVNVRNIPAL